MVLTQRGRVVEQGHFQPLAFGSSVLEPELDVLRLEPWELLPISHAVQLFGVLQDEVVRGVGV